MSTATLDKIKSFDQKFIRTDLPALEVGDFVKMKIKVNEAGKIRIHPFEGTIIKKTNKGAKSTFTVRKISFGEGVERVFPIHSPVIESIQVISKGITKRARLYFLRERTGKKTRLKKDVQNLTQTPTAATTV